ncbi:hypothetical protein ASPWEDRAFT_623743 [Aspergillus wentii DTO 134E9]|uniref:Uncharacterized protein n=1 Tax=Aspergillus wentii DTO 134E9 TaxID=1073089 RepID=A0A1L9RF15_ASPWE|nr:uncharacterized protein ASPWEDRAFT_623743 [Aspergillus wentii DTO 134E9]KAI9926192.1 hypothetical protein MW887_004655 [Aspergillus wentii]OJJ33516.1 hypothetical protein ASPWEDRAFT_623743 [Aspergillus wentii DTO 134E9]
MPSRRQIHQTPPETSSSRVIHLPASDFHNCSALCSYINERIPQSKEDTKFTLTEVNSTWADEMLRVLGETRLRIRFEFDTTTQILQLRIMISEIHNAAQLWYQAAWMYWMASGLTTRDESMDIRGLGVGMGSLSGSGVDKAPYFMVRPRRSRIPRVVFESGWSESLDDLHSDINKWLVGGDGAVQVVILLKWSKVESSNRVRGSVELYTLARDGTPKLQQREQIFPIPAEPDTQPIRLTRRMLFGSNIAPGRNPQDAFALDVAVLRADAVDLLERMNRVPA